MSASATGKSPGSASLPRRLRRADVRRRARARLDARGPRRAERRALRATFFVLAAGRGAPASWRASRRRARVELHGNDHLRHTEHDRAAIEGDTERALATLAASGSRPRCGARRGARASGPPAIAADRGLRAAGGTPTPTTGAATAPRRCSRRSPPTSRRAPSCSLHDGLGPGALREGCAETVALHAHGGAPSRCRGAPTTSPPCSARLAASPRARPRATATPAFPCDAMTPRGRRRRSAGRGRSPSEWAVVRDVAPPTPRSGASSTATQRGRAPRVRRRSRCAARAGGGRRGRRWLGVWGADPGPARASRRAIVATATAGPPASRPSARRRRAARGARAGARRRRPPRRLRRSRTRASRSTARGSPAPGCAPRRATACASTARRCTRCSAAPASCCASRGSRATRSAPPPAGRASPTRPPTRRSTRSRRARGRRRPRGAGRRRGSTRRADDRPLAGRGRAPRGRRPGRRDAHASVHLREAVAARRAGARSTRRCGPAARARWRPAAPWTARAAT